MTDAHRHVPSLSDPNDCADCQGPWNAIQHQPSLVAVRALEAVRKLSGLPEDLQALAPYERPSGAPFRPSVGAPATHTGRPAQHSGQDSEVYEFCDHPNGLGVYGCPCGAVQGGEDDPMTVRNLSTGEDVPATRCPECGDPFPVSQIRQHLTEHGWRPSRIDDWMESVGVMDVPLIPAVLEEAMAEREANRQEMEEAMTDMFTEKIDANELAEAMVPNALEALLSGWWMDLAEEEVRRVVPKAVEYGALDLIQIGHDLALTAGRQVTDEEAAEMGIYFYIRGKLARWTDAIARGDRPSDDTLHDLGVYVRMAQRVRHSGGWPGLPKN